MARLMIGVVFLLYAQSAVSQLYEDIFNSAAIRDSNRRRSSGQASTFLSGLGELFLDVDETFNRQTAPKVHAEDRRKEQMYGRPRSGQNYFNQVQQNYRELQKRLGESLGSANIRMSSGLGSVNIQNKGPKSAIDVSLPLPVLPVKFSVHSNQVSKEASNTDDLTKTSNKLESGVLPQLELPQFTSNFKLGDTEINLGSKAGSGILPDVSLDIKQDELKTFEPVKRENNNMEVEETSEPKDEEPSPEIKMANKRQKSYQNTLTDKFASRMGSKVEPAGSPETDDSGPVGRLLGDAFYSEARYDNYMKRLLRDSRWALEFNESPSRIAEKIRRYYEETVSRPSDEMDLEKAGNGKRDFKELRPISRFESDQTRELPISSGEAEAGRHYEEELKINFIKNRGSELRYEMVDSTQPRIPPTRVVLAFTPDGIPLKLRMGAEMSYPLKFLNRVLRAAGVSLNLPVVSSYRDVHPVGEDVLKLGTGGLSEAFYVDVSEPSELESLLRILKKYQMR